MNHTMQILFNKSHFMFRIKLAASTVIHVLFTCQHVRFNLNALVVVFHVCIKDKVNHMSENCLQYIVIVPIDELTVSGNTVFERRLQSSNQGNFAHGPNQRCGGLILTRRPNLH